MNYNFLYKQPFPGILHVPAVGAHRCINSSGFSKVGDFLLLKPSNTPVIMRVVQAYVHGRIKTEIQFSHLDTGRCTLQHLRTTVLIRVKFTQVNGIDSSGTP